MHVSEFRKRRRAIGSQMRVAVLLGLHRRTIENIEKGTGEVRDVYAWAIQGLEREISKNGPRWVDTQLLRLARQRTET